MFVFSLVLLMILSILLIGVVLLQPGKGDMISGMGTLGGSFSSMLGSRRATDLLTKVTVGLGAAIILLSLFTNMFLVGNNATGPRPVTEGVVIPQTVPTSPEQTQIPVPEQAPAQAPAQDAPQEQPAE